MATSTAGYIFNSCKVKHLPTHATESLSYCPSLIVLSDSYTSTQHAPPIPFFRQRIREPTLHNTPDLLKKKGSQQPWQLAAHPLSSPFPRSSSNRSMRFPLLSSASKRASPANMGARTAAFPHHSAASHRPGGVSSARDWGGRNEPACQQWRAFLGYC